jgi:hypothetical protein
LGEGGKTNFKLELDKFVKTRNNRKFSGKLGYTFVDWVEVEIVKGIGFL